MPTIFDPRTTWTNYHSSFNKRIKGIYLLQNGSGSTLEKYNATAKEVQKLLGQASGKHTLRGYGSEWSLSELAHGSDYMINNKNLTLFFPIREQSLDLAFKGDAQNPRIFLFQAGLTIKKISVVLDGLGLSIKTSGASDGQTIAGALSAGTHGSALDFGAIPEFVVGLHIATSPQRTVWLERASYPVLDRTVAAGFNAELIRDDALFNAALVGLGSFGMILGVAIEAEPRYLLEVWSGKLPNDAALTAAMDQFDFSQLSIGHAQQRPHHFSLVVNPHTPNEVYATLMYKRPYVAGYASHNFADPDGGLGDDALEFIGRAIDFLPLLTGNHIPGLVTQILEDRYERVNGTLGTHREVFPATSTRGKVCSTGVAFPREAASSTLAAVLAMHATDGPFPGALGVRFVKQSTATLGFTRFASNCIIEADGVECDAANAFYQAFWGMMESGPTEYTMHWGKMNNLNRTRVKTMYGDRLQQWTDARNTLLDASMRAVFASPLTTRMGLT